MRSSHLIAPLVAAGLVAGGVVAVTAGGQGSPTPPTGTLTVTLVTKGTFVDVPPKAAKRGPGPGDMFIGTGTVTGDAKGTARFTYTFVTRDNGIINGAINLADGQLFIEEWTVDAKVTRAAIIGGTGKYAGARGDLEDRTLKSTDTSDTDRLTFNFVG